MKDLARIEALWIKLDLALEAELASLADRDRGKIIDQQVLNDQAYFILCWGQLENEINGQSRNAVRRRNKSADWQVRRAWDLYNPDEPRFSGLSFDSRARLVLDGQAGRKSAFALAMKHYNSRNQIAHGALQKTRIDVSAFVADCYLIQSALHRAP